MSRVMENDSMQLSRRILDAFRLRSFAGTWWPE